MKQPLRLLLPLTVFIATASYGQLRPASVAMYLNGYYQDDYTTKVSEIGRLTVAMRTLADKGFYHELELSQFGILS